MPKTSSYYTTADHRYLQNVPCANPLKCTRKAHWVDNNNEFRTLAEAEDWARNGDDAPATRIYHVVVVHTENRKLVKTLRFED